MLSDQKAAARGDQLSARSRRSVTVGDFGESELQASQLGHEDRLEPGSLKALYRNMYHSCMKTTLRVAFIDALLASPGVQLAPLGPEWSNLRQLCLDKQLTGNDLPDAWLSAAVAHLGEHLVSFDRNFRKLLARSQFTLLAPA